MMLRLPEEEQYRILWEKYGMTEDEVKKHKVAGFSYYDLDKAAMYAFVAQKPLEDVLALRRDYAWMKIELLLGITPQLLHDRDLLRKAHCAEKWWGIDAKEVYRLFMAGYPIHHIKLAWIISQHSSMTMDEVLLSRKKSVSWFDWAQQTLGIAPDDLKSWIRQYPNPSIAKKSNT